MKISGKFGNIDILTGQCHISTIKDGRGAIFTWLPNEKILEFNMVMFSPGKIRGNHSHPEFHEYFLVVDGEVTMVTKDPNTGTEIAMIASKGVCFHTPPGTSHAVHALTPATCVSLLSKPWDECEEPIIHEDLIPQDNEYIEYAKKQGFEYSIEEIKGKKE